MKGPQDIDKMAGMRKKVPFPLWEIKQPSPTDTRGKRQRKSIVHLTSPVVDSTLSCTTRPIPHSNRKSAFEDFSKRVSSTTTRPSFEVSEENKKRYSERKYVIVSPVPILSGNNLTNRHWYINKKLITATYQILVGIRTLSSLYRTQTRPKTISSEALSKVPK